MANKPGRGWPAGNDHSGSYDKATGSGTNADPYIPVVAIESAAALPAGEAHLGQVGGHSTVVDITPSCDTGALGANQVIAATEVVTGVFRAADKGGLLTDLLLIDKDDQKAALDIYLLSANVAIGTENENVSITDGDAASILCRIPIAVGDYVDLGGVSIVNLSALNRTLKPISGTTSLAIAVVNGAGTPTYTASGLVVRLGIQRD